jgi:DNA-binding transcriptional MerR regulator
VSIQTASDSAARLLSIGEVLNELRGEFDDISVSKIRFLESSGLVTPARTASGYRKFSLVDLDHLRYILRVQRDHFLPLRVIREHIDAMNRGLEPPALTNVAPTMPRALVSTDTLATNAKPTTVKLAKNELARECDVTIELVDELIEYGLLSNTEFFVATDVAVVASAKELSAFGLTARHLKTVATAAAREVDLIAPIAKSQRTAKNANSRAEVEETAIAIGNLLSGLHHNLVRGLIDSQYRS